MKINFRIIIISVGLLLLPVGAALALGQMVAPIVFDQAVRGQEIVETLILLSSDAEDKFFGLISEGDVAGWVKFYNVNDKKFENPIEKVLIPAKGQGNAVAVITVPDDTPNGKYAGFLTVASIPEDAEEADETMATVMQKVPREVFIKVTDQEIVDFTVSIIPDKYDIEKNESLPVRFIFQNNGNVKISPQIQVKIKELEGDKIFSNAIFPYPDGEPPVKPGDYYEIPKLEIPTTNVGNGRYWMQFSFIVNGEVVKEGAFRFTVGRSGKILGAVFSGFSNGILSRVGLIILAVLGVGFLMIMNNRFQSKAIRRQLIEAGVICDKKSSRLAGQESKKAKRATSAKSSLAYRKKNNARKPEKDEIGFFGKLREGKSWISGFFS